MVSEAPLRQTDHGLVPEGEGWFVVNGREARWFDAGRLGSYCPFEGDDRFPELGINLNVLEPGESNGMYHREGAQEAFFLLAGECLLLVEGEERLLRPWDFVHCPAGTAHIFIGAGEGPCLLLAVGRRPGEGAVFPVSDVAQRHGVGVERETSSTQEAYAWLPAGPKGGPVRYREGWLPDR